MNTNIIYSVSILCGGMSTRMGEDKALLISATGTGKTYASAFALRDIDPKRALFIVHREQIAKQAMNSFKKVFQDTRSFGLISGTSRETAGRTVCLAPKIAQ